MAASSLFRDSNSIHWKKSHEILSISLQIFLAFVIIMAGGCKSSTDSSDGPKGIQSQEDADRVITIIIQQAFEPAPHYTSATWNSTTVNGRIAGTAVVTGSYQEKWSGLTSNTTTEAYHTVQISYNGYCSDNSYPTMTGYSGINGTITCHSSYGSNSYSGSWAFAGNVDLSGSRYSDNTWAYTGNVWFYITFSSPYAFSGHIEWGDQRWDVSGE